MNAPVPLSLYNYVTWLLETHPSHLPRPRQELAVHPITPPPVPWGQPQPSPWATLSPDPVPWMPGAALLLQALAAKEVAGAMPQGSARTALEQQSDQAIDEAIDGYCGTPWHWPWPWPGPPVWWQEVVSFLSFVASSLPEGQLRGQVLQAAGRIAQNALSGAAPRAAAGSRAAGR